MATTVLDSNLPVTAQAHSNWVVQKFGGTSVGKFARNIIKQVVQYDAFSRIRLDLMETDTITDPAL